METFLGCAILRHIYYNKMGKSVPSSAKIQEFAKTITSNKHHPTSQLPTSRIRPNLSLETAKSKIKTNMEEDKHKRLPLAEVVGECVKRWFQDSLKEAKAGDISMQVLVGQMYYSGYGVPMDPLKGRAWISRASKSRSSAWKVIDKRPGYNVSDSDSDDTVEDTK